MARRRGIEDKSNDSGFLRLPDATQISEGELTKSSQTRLRILNAAIDCLAETGYAGTTTGTVAKRAGLTRTAMLYHFPSRNLLIEATIYHIMRLRIDMYAEDVKNILPDDVAPVVDIAWRHVQTNVFAAFTELLIAAHTDTELSHIFEPALAEYDRARRAISLRTLPKKDIEAPWFNLRRDIFRFLLEGFAMQRGLSYNAEERQAGLLSFLRALTSTREGDALLRVALSGQKNGAGRKGTTRR